MKGPVNLIRFINFKSTLVNLTKNDLTQTSTDNKGLDSNFKSNKDLKFKYPFYIMNSTLSANLLFFCKSLCFNCFMCNFDELLELKRSKLFYKTTKHSKHAIDFTKLMPLSSQINQSKGILQLTNKNSCLRCNKFFINISKKAALHRLKTNINLKVQENKNFKENNNLHKSNYKKDYDKKKYFNYSVSSNEFKELYKKCTRNNIVFFLTLFQSKYSFLNFELFSYRFHDLNSYFNNYQSTITESISKKSIKDNFKKVKKIFDLAIQSKNSLKNFSEFNEKSDLEIIYSLLSNINNEQTRVKRFKKLIEKKIGLIRSNILGKRVNFSGRSVATPDPLIKSGEVGLPKIVAKSLLIHDYLSSINIAIFKFFLYAQIRKTCEVFFFKYNLKSPNKYSTVFLFKIELMKFFENNVFRPHYSRMSHHFLKSLPFMRNLKQDDYVLVNRQPTLHNLGLLSHKIKLISTDHTIKMNYINCKSYNLDFDGDEINFHVIRGYESKSESTFLTFADVNNVSSKDSSLMRNLIQDNLVMLRILTFKDFFIDFTDVSKIYCATEITNVEKLKPIIYSRNTKKGYFTGLQIINFLLLDCNISLNEKRILYFKKSLNKKLAFDLFPNEKNAIIVNNGEITNGILDSYDFKSNKLFNKIQQSTNQINYSIFVNKLSHLLYKMTSKIGITFGINDLVFKNDKRDFLSSFFYNFKNGLIRYKNSFYCYTRVFKTFSSKFVTLVENNEERIILKLKGLENKLLLFSKNKFKEEIYKRKTSSNSLLNMVKAGAKGSERNIFLITFFMGRIELSLYPNLRNMIDINRIVNNFIFGNYLLGLSNFEFFAHTLSGRLGLLDTATKVSRSGYLQRSLIKMLENLYLENDATIRNSINKEILDFYYYSVSDVIMKPNDNQYNEFRRVLQFLKNNYCKQKLDIYSLFSLIKKWHRYLNRTFTNGKVTFNDEISFNKYFVNFYQTFTLSKLHQNLFNFYFKSNSYKFYSSSKKLNNLNFFNFYFMLMIYNFLIISRAKQTACFSPLGVLCGQSIGEPLTQMTLNTFHNTGIVNEGVNRGIPYLVQLVQGLYIHSKKIPMLALKLNRSIYNYKDSFNILLNRNFTLNTISMMDFIFSVKSINSSSILISNSFQIVNIGKFVKRIRLNIYNLSLKLSKTIFKRIIKLIFKVLYYKYSKQEYKKPYIHRISNYFLNYRKSLKKKINLIYKVPLLKLIQRTISSIKFRYFIDYRSKSITITVKNNNKTNMSLLTMGNSKFLNEKIYGSKKLTNSSAIVDSKASCFFLITKGISINCFIKKLKFISLNCSTFHKLNNHRYYFGIESCYNLIYWNILNTISHQNIKINKIHIKIICSYMTFKVTKNILGFCN
ncbi:largest subunit of RNA polymerase I (nucleomorph) [Bigelowiella natans]|uniref:DNA-directed RNA polymerase n=1 Tax=Bigelowiella natans TaxID=227086 RepID=Q3LWH2_BIGNA|nr:largest subunit of RNA polymerase I [Bigelowiella natans]ABA27194.1 largest subunit of RNA polymerase I [Bigelowiella natans]